ncbi:uncharacterized protein LOC117116252 [Anneissia japonica]|uniref:uncharacterized protein LOC117116252 n=1 Tax=Anneissia japonica TaxID=1529436 RepID=UPI001425571A|nr:uncharacterized protein LOC117116252 [Anneissia japonica]
MAGTDSLFPAISRISSTSLPKVYWEDDQKTTERMQLFLNSALCVIYNLSKSTKHREKFRTPEMRRILDIYKGSPSSTRRLFSMLAISYVADPSTDMSLLEDKYGVIGELTDYLHKSLILQNSTKFSVQELVDGFANLAVHPINKIQIVEKSLHLFYTILERNITKTLTLHVKQLLDRWDISDVGCTTVSEQCQEETAEQNKSGQCHEVDSKESANNMQMLDNSRCVLSKCDDFGTNEVKKTIGAVKCIVSDKTRDRQNIFKHMTMNQWPDLLVRTIANVWKPKKEIYTNELLWSILTDTIDTMVNYSNADVEFADILIERGALALMQNIADGYYRHLKQKVIALDKKIREYRGETLSSNQPGADKYHSINPSQTIVRSGQPGTNETHSVDPTQTKIQTGRTGTDKAYSVGPTQTDIPSGQAEKDEHQSTVPTQTNIPSAQLGKDEHHSTGSTQNRMSSNQKETDKHQSMNLAQPHTPSGQQGTDKDHAVGPIQNNNIQSRHAEKKDDHQPIDLTQINIPSQFPGPGKHQSTGSIQIEEQMGKVVAEGQPTNDTTQTEDSSHCNQSDANSGLKLCSDTTHKKDSNEKVTSYTLKPVSQYACVNYDSTIAYRENSDVIFNRAVFVSNEPIKSSTFFELSIDKTSDRHNGSMELGVCMCNTFSDDSIYEGNGYGKGSGFWFLRDDELWKDFAAIGGGYKLNLRNIVVNDTVGFVRYPDGTLEFLLNGERKGIAFRNVPEGVYGLVAVTGKCVRVAITCKAGIKKTQEKSVKIPDDPFELYSVETVSGQMKSFSRMRTPYGLDFVDEKRHPIIRNVSKEKGDFVDEKRHPIIRNVYKKKKLYSVGTVSSQMKSFSRMRTPYGLDFVDEKRHPIIRNVSKKKGDFVDEKRDPIIRNVYKKKDNIICNTQVDWEKSLTPLYEINKRSFAGYLNEIDLRATLKSVVNLYNIYDNPSTRVDPISNDPIQFITRMVNLMGDMLKLLFAKDNWPPNASSTLPKRRQQIFNAVRSCFDNIKDMSGIVWTGSTSEGFAIADNSGPGTPYVDDEMDLMIPLAMATEDSQSNICEDVAIDKQTITIFANELKIKDNETRDFKKESLVTELEEIGKHQQLKKCPPFIWRPSHHPGYVSVFIPKSMQSYISKEFIKYLCSQLTSVGGSDLILTRSKLLAIQEEYIRKRLPAVQSDIKSTSAKSDDQFQILKLVQEGPVQTLLVCYQLKEEKQPKCLMEGMKEDGSVLQFDQTVDVAIALKGVNWPTIANPWVSRLRDWPEKRIVDKIIKDGYHIVPKCYPGGSGIDVEWRLSFSVAERTLAHTFTDTQRKCYLIFKKLWRKYLKVISCECPF